jgi:hypothetical protein
MTKRKQVRVVLQRITRRELENELTQKLLDMLCTHLRDRISEAIKYNIKWPLYASLNA